jgi:hypothetical protein
VPDAQWMAGQLAQALTLRLPPLTLSTKCCDVRRESHDGTVEMQQAGSLVDRRSPRLRNRATGHTRLSAVLGAGV